MNGFVRFLCLIFGISVDGGAAQREQWAKRRRDLGIEPPEDEDAPHDDGAERQRASGEPAQSERK